MYSIDCPRILEFQYVMYSFLITHKKYILWIFYLFVLLLGMSGTSSDLLSISVLSELDGKRYKILVKEANFNKLKVEDIKKNLQNITGLSPAGNYTKLPLSTHLLALGLTNPCTTLNNSPLLYMSL
jgi:hypothetical protein